MTVDASTIRRPYPSTLPRFNMDSSGNTSGMNLSIPPCGTPPFYEGMDCDEEPYSPLTISRFVLDYSDHIEVGAGDYGNVTAATYNIDSQQYAIKETKKEVHGELDLQHRLQEVYALSCCESPHLIRYYYSWADGAKVLLQTEFVPGGTAMQLPKDAWTEWALWDFMNQVALGLHTMHCANVAHLDVKPDNVFVTYDQTTGRRVFKLGDFGLARHVPEFGDDNEQYAGQNDEEGDYRYLCPAFLSCGFTNSKHIREADIYSLGASLVSLAGGVPNEVHNQNYSGIAHLSQPLQDAIKWLTRLNPLERPSAFEVVRMSATNSCFSAPVACGSARTNAVLQDLQDQIARETAELERLRAL